MIIVCGCDFTFLLRAMRVDMVSNPHVQILCTPRGTCSLSLSPFNRSPPHPLDETMSYLPVADPGISVGGFCERNFGVSHPLLIF